MVSESQTLSLSDGSSSLDVERRQDWGRAGGEGPWREGERLSLIVVKMGKKQDFKLEERMATEQLRFWDGRSADENLYVLWKHGIQTRDKRADLSVRRVGAFTI